MLFRSGEIKFPVVGPFLSDLNQEIKQEASYSEDLYIVPGKPQNGFYPRELKSIVVGLDSDTNQKHLLRAYFESIACLIKIYFDKLEFEGQVAIKNVFATGALSQNVPLLQIMSDILQLPISTVKEVDPACWGGAVLAGKVSGVWDEKQLKKTSGQFLSIVPNLDPLSSLAFFNRWQSMSDRCQEKG